MHLNHHNHPREETKHILNRKYGFLQRAIQIIISIKRYWFSTNQFIYCIFNTSVQNDTINGPNLQQNEYLKVIKGNQEKHDSFLSNYLFLNKFTRNKTCLFTIYMWKLNLSLFIKLQLPVKVEVCVLNIFSQEQYHVKSFWEKMSPITWPAMAQLVGGGVRCFLALFCKFVVKPIFCIIL